MQGFRTQSDKALKWAFIVAVSIVLLLILLPVLHAIQLSFYHSESFVSNKNWVGLGNYMRILNEVIFWKALSGYIKNPVFDTKSGALSSITSINLPA